MAIASTRHQPSVAAGPCRHTPERSRAARQLARHNIAVFEATDAEWVVVNSAGCGALMKEYGHLLRDDPAFAARAEAFSKRVRDVSEVLTAAPLRQPLHPVPLRVAYDDPCHLLHGQKIHEQPRHVLQQIPELTLLEVPKAIGAVAALAFTTSSIRRPHRPCSTVR